MKPGSLTVLSVSILLMISGLVGSLKALESPTIGLKLGYTKSQLRAAETGIVYRLNMNNYVFSVGLTYFF